MTDAQELTERETNLTAPKTMLHSRNCPKQSYFGSKNRGHNCEPLFPQIHKMKHCHYHYGGVAFPTTLPFYQMEKKQHHISVLPWKTTLTEGLFL